MEELTKKLEDLEDKLNNRLTRPGMTWEEIRDTAREINLAMKMSHKHYDLRFKSIKEIIVELKKDLIESVTTKGETRNEQQDQSKANVEKEKGIENAATSYCAGLGILGPSPLQKQGQKETWSSTSTPSSGHYSKKSGEDIIESWRKIKQKGNIAEYMEVFEELKARCMMVLPNLPESYYISIFTCGLKEEIRATIKMFKPSTLSKTFELAQLQESSLFALSKTKPPYKPIYSNHRNPNTYNHTTYNPNSSTPKISQNPIHQSPPNYKTISLTDIQIKRSLGLYFKCNALSLYIRGTGHGIVMDEEMRMKFVSGLKEKPKNSFDFFQRSRNAILGASDDVSRVATNGAFGEDNRRTEALVTTIDGAGWSGCSNGLLVQWDGNGNHLQEFQYFSFAVQSLCTSESRLWEGYVSDAPMQVLDLTGNLLGGWAAHSSTLLDLAFGTDYVFTLANHGGIRGWSITFPGPLDDVPRSELDGKEYLYTRLENLKILVGTWSIGQGRESPGFLISWLCSATADIDIDVVELKEEDDWVQEFLQQPIMSSIASQVPKSVPLLTTDPVTPFATASLLTIGDIYQTEVFHVLLHCPYKINSNNYLVVLFLPPSKVHRYFCSVSSFLRPPKKPPDE